MKAFLKRHKGELDKARTVFINIDEVGAGTVRFGRREGMLLPGQVAPAAVRDREADRRGRWRGRLLFGQAADVLTPTDASIARTAGYPAMTIACRNAVDYAPRHHQPSDIPENIEDDALERAYGFTAELIHRLDAEIGPDLSRRGTVLAEADSEA